MKSVLSGVRTFSKLLLTGLNPHIQEIVSLLFTMILNKRKNLSCVFLLLRGHNFLSVKGCNRWGWVKARSKPLVTSMTKETNFLFFPNRQSACPFVKSVCAFRQSGLQSVCLTKLYLSCLESRSHSSFSFFSQLESLFRRKLWFLIHENSKKSSLWSSMIMQQNTHHGSQELKESPNSLKLKAGKQYQWSGIKHLSE